MCVTASGTAPASGHGAARGIGSSAQAVGLVVGFALGWQGVEPGKPAKQRGGCVEGFVPPRPPVHWAVPVRVSFAGFVLVDAGLPPRGEVSPVAVGRSAHAASGAGALHGVRARVLRPAGRSRVVSVVIQLGTALALLPAWVYPSRVLLTSQHTGCPS